MRLLPLESLSANPHRIRPGSRSASVSRRAADDKIPIARPGDRQAACRGLLPGEGFEPVPQPPKESIRRARPSVSSRRRRCAADAAVDVRQGSVGRSLVCGSCRAGREGKEDADTARVPASKARTVSSLASVAAPPGNGKAAAEIATAAARSCVSVNGPETFSVPAKQSADSFKFGVSSQRTKRR